MRRRRPVLAAALGVAMLTGLPACAFYPVRQEPARLRLVSEPITARVYVDEQYAGSGRVLSQRPIALGPGQHRLTVTAPGFFPHDLIVDLPRGTTTVRVALRPEPQRPE